MFKFDNTHIFTGYLKQQLSIFNLPTCKVYTKEFAEYAALHGKEDPRVIESFDTIEYMYGNNKEFIKKRAAARVNYLRNNELYNYFLAQDKNSNELSRDKGCWVPAASAFYTGDNNIPGLTRTLNSPGNSYDTTTHEYLGDYLRFLRDYNNINLMSLYNCFNNKICNNIYYKHKVKIANASYNKYKEESSTNPAYIEAYRVFDAHDTKYRIYAIPVKLFADYTIAIDCNQEIELFCGFYKTALDTSEKSIDLINRTYKKINKTLFKQPFLYDSLNVKYWNFDVDAAILDETEYPQLFNSKVITRWDIANREQDLKLFVKVPVSCKSSIVILEGDFRNFNDFKYSPSCYNADGSVFDPEVDDSKNTKTTWSYSQNHTTINFEDKHKLNDQAFKPIGKLQLLALNTSESYPFADRLIEYLCASATTPIDEISDNIARAQKVMSQNHNYFNIDGLWEDKMQKIIYDYMTCAGPIETYKTDNGTVKLVDKRRGIHPRIGYTSKSTLYDILGYIDRDVEKWYASWTKDGDKAKVLYNIQNVDIYNGLFDI